MSANILAKNVFISLGKKLSITKVITIFILTFDEEGVVKAKLTPNSLISLCNLRGAGVYVHGAISAIC